jgi:hypothetical protein
MLPIGNRGKVAYGTVKMRCVRGIYVKFVSHHAWAGGDESEVVDRQALLKNFVPVAWSAASLEES